MIVQAISMTLKERAVVKAEGDKRLYGKTSTYAVKRAGQIYGRSISRRTYYRVLERLNERVNGQACESG
jgi:hypothetical protein